MPSGGGERCCCRKIHEACMTRDASARPKRGMREDDQLATNMGLQRRQPHARNPAELLFHDARASCS